MSVSYLALTSRNYSVRTAISILAHRGKHSFETLAHEVLPSYLAELKANMANSPMSLAYAAQVGVGPVAFRRHYGHESETPGCYVLSEGSRPVYVGISRGVFKRLVDHVKGDDHLTATFAYHIAKDKHPHGMTAAQAMDNPAFSERFKVAREYVCGLQAAFVAIENPLELYLFEPYAALELGTGKDCGGWNTFITH